MSSDIAIKVDNLSKCYEIYDTPRDRLKQFVLPRLRRRVGLAPAQYYKEFWALKDVSFEVKKGETVGIIGRNGSGKSTLLQVICGTLNQTSGSVITNGRIAALLELGSGFNPEFNGRENVYMSCALLGLGKEEVDNRFDDIAAFADIGDFIEQPVKTYSSGMFVRLAFAVNVISSPDIMVVDEALAVGDMNFQAKCMTALTRFQENGGTVLFVSHDVGAVKSLCQQAVYLEHGQVASAGPAPEVAERYVRAMREEMSQDALKFVSASSNLPTKEKLSPDILGSCTDTAKDTPENVALFKHSADFEQRMRGHRYGIGGAKIRFVELLDISGEPVVIADFNQRVKIRVHVECEQQTDLSVNYYIHDSHKTPLVGAAFRTVGHPLIRCSAGEMYVITYTTSLPLQEGAYSIHVELTRPTIPDQAADFLDVIDDAVVFKVGRRAEGRVWAKLLLDNQVSIAKAES